MKIENVSLCVVALNESKFIDNLLADLFEQTYPKSKTEIVLIDSGSSDCTKDKMLDFKNKYSSLYLGIQVLDNPKRIQAAGWNVAIKNFKTEVIIRIDAHTSIPKEFVEKNMLNINKGEFVSGGKRPCLIEHDTSWSRLLLEVENSLFGSSVNASRRSEKPQYVKTLFHGAYRREVFDKVGLFNEKLLRTEDNEMHYRIRKAGFKIYYDPEIVSYQYARSNLKAMIKQKYSNGLWIGLTLGVCPGCLSIYHLIPFAFLIGIIITTLLAMSGHYILMNLMWLLYLLFVCFGTIVNIITNKFSLNKLLMPVLYFSLHISYGIGTLIGILRIPFTKNDLRTDGDERN